MRARRAGSFGSGWGRLRKTQFQISAAMRSVTPRLASPGRGRADQSALALSARSWLTAGASSAGLGMGRARLRGENSSAMAAKFSMCGPTMMGFAEIGGLENVVAAARRQRSSHENRSGFFEEPREFTDCIEQENAG